MIQSLAFCEKEEMIFSSNFVNDQDEEISTVKELEDEMQLYQAMKLRTEHGQFAMNIGATNILDQAYLDADDSQASNDADENSMDDPEPESELMDLEEDDLDNLMASTAQVGKPRGVDPKHLSMKMPRIPLMSPPKLPFKKIIQFFPETTPQMTGC